MSELRTRTAVALVVALGVAIVLVFLGLPLGEWMLAAVDWVRGAAWLGVLAFGALYVLGTVLALPVSVLSLGAGFVYGPFWGTVLVSPVSVLGATLCFVLARTLLRGWVARRVATSSIFSALDEAVANDGFKIVLLTRLSPLFPFNLLNYALGLTRIGLGDYVWASFLGMLPGTLLFVYTGSLVTNVTLLLRGQSPASGGWGQGFYWLGLLATLGVTVWATKVARGALSENLGDPHA